MEQSYIPYLMNKFVEMIQYISVKFPKLLEDVIFNNLVKHLKNNSKYFKNWKPSGGYSLLHGDLHIGNIVKRNGNYLLIDFEYLRYGATEFEIANLIISSLFWYCKRNYDDNKLKSLITNYFKTCIQFSFLNNYIFFKFFFIFSLILYYLSAYIGKKGKDDLATIRKIIRLNNIVNQGYKY